MSKSKTSGFEITTDSSVLTTQFFHHAFNSDTPAADALTVDASAFLIAEGGAAFGADLAPTGAWKVSVNGSIFSLQSTGLFLENSNVAASTITVGTEGEIGGNTVGIYTGSAATITNDGSIGANQIGILLFAGNHTVNNSGTISGGTFAIQDAAANNDTVVNVGTITGDIDLGGGINALTNSGTILQFIEGGLNGGVSNTLTNSGLVGVDTDASLGLTASVIFRDGAGDKVTNSGEVEGDIYLGTGTNTFSNTGTTGGVHGGNGQDTFTNSQDIAGDVDLGAGINVLTNSGHIEGDVISDTLNSGVATITNSGTIDTDLYPYIGQILLGSIFLGPSADKVTNSGVLTGDAYLGGGDNTFGNSGTAANIIAYLGNDTITNTKTLTGGVSLGDGVNSLTNSGTIGTGVIGGLDADTVTNKGMILGHVFLGDGSNHLTNSGAIGTNVNGGINDDTVTNSGTISGHVDLGDGSNHLTNSGTIGGVVSGGDSDDTITNSHTINNNVLLGDGANHLTNSGSISGAVTGGSDSDIVSNTGLVFEVDLKDGNDQFTGGNFDDFVLDGGGSDKVLLGGGNDTYSAVGSSGPDGFDFIDGGAGIDDYNAIVATHELFVNIDTVAHDLSPFAPGAETVDAQTAIGSDVSNLSVDTITNFENVLGGDGNDIIYGSAAVNVLDGFGGDDYIFGYGGNDTLDGGTGNDELIGGLGKDKLTGGDGNDSYAYTSTVESGVGKGARDLITDFDDGHDQIDVRRIDANTTNAPGTVDHFNFIGTNVVFDHHPGELRAYWTQSGQIIEGDVNGDGKADFSIELTDQHHTISLSNADFILS